MLDKMDSDLECTPITLKHLSLMPDDCSSEAAAKKALKNVEQISKNTFGCVQRCSWEKFNAG
jgi:hypothetical protein